MSTATHTESGGKRQLSIATVESLIESVDQRTEDWSKFRKRMSGKKPIPLRKRLTNNALSWGLTEELLLAIPWLQPLFQLKKQTLDDCDWNQEANGWLSAVECEDVVWETALPGLAWCHALPSLVDGLESETWRELLRRLIRIGSTPSDATDPFVRLLLVGELPITLAYVLRTVNDFSELLGAGRRNVSAILDEVLDGEGMPHARHLDRIQLLLASCVRCLVMDAELKHGKIDKAARLQFDWLVRQTLRWSRADGTTILQTTSPSAYFDELMKAALELTDDKHDLAAYKVLRGKRKPPADSDETPACSEHSEWSELATTRTGWSPTESRLAVDFTSRGLRIELATEERTLLLGSSLPRIAVDDRQLQLTGDWEEVCWEVDGDMDYIELEAQLSGQWRIQRQMLLARADKFVFLADAILGPSSGMIHYDHTLPLADSVSAEQPPENSEIYLLAPKRVATIIPPSLSEWKSDGHDGRLTASPLTLSVRHQGTALYAPLFFDLDSERRRKALTWRRLTVGQDLQIVPRNEAVAFRVHIGKQQWVFYRSLGQLANRTFIGVNLTSEFLAARFDTDGEIEALIDIAG